MKTNSAMDCLEDWATFATDTEIKLTKALNNLPPRSRVRQLARAVMLEAQEFKCELLDAIQEDPGPLAAGILAVLDARKKKGGPEMKPSKDKLKRLRYTR